MAIYKGRVKARQLATRLYEILTEQGYNELSSDKVNDGHVYRTTGIDGKNEFYIRIKDPATYHYLEVGVYEKYIPNPILTTPGTFENGLMHTAISWNSGNRGDVELDYIININLDRIIIFVSGMPAQTGTTVSLTYIGLPTRYDPDNDIGGKFAGIAGTTGMVYNAHNSWSALRNRANVAASYSSPAYSTNFYLPSRSFGWNNQLFFSPIVIGNSAEGARGELSGLYVCEQVDAMTELRHGDIFIQNGKTYMLIAPRPAWTGTENLYQVHDYIMEV